MPFLVSIFFSRVESREKWSLRIYHSEMWRKMKLRMSFIIVLVSGIPCFFRKTFFCCLLLFYCRLKWILLHHWAFDCFHFLLDTNSICVAPLVQLLVTSNWDFNGKNQTKLMSWRCVHCNPPLIFISKNGRQASSSEIQRSTKMHPEWTAEWNMRTYKLIYKRKCRWTTERFFAVNLYKLFFEIKLNSVARAHGM